METESDVYYPDYLQTGDRDNDIQAYNEIKDQCHYIDYSITRVVKMFVDLCSEFDDKKDRSKIIGTFFDFLILDEVNRGYIYSHPSFERTVVRKLYELSSEPLIQDRARLWREVLYPHDWEKIVSFKYLEV